VATHAFLLGDWTAELVVLRLCGFTGLYRSRINDNVWTGVVDPVPWRVTHAAIEEAPKEGR